MSEETATRMGKSSERLSTPFARAPGFSCTHYFPAPFHGPLGQVLPPPPRVSPSRAPFFLALTSSKRLPTPTLKQHYQ